MKNFFESGFLMSHEGSFPMGVKLSKSKKVYPKCVVAQRLGLLSKYSSLCNKRVNWIKRAVGIFCPIHSNFATIFLGWAFTKKA